MLHPDAPHRTDAQPLFERRMVAGRRQFLGDLSVGLTGTGSPEDLGDQLPPVPISAYVTTGRSRTVVVQSPPFQTIRISQLSPTGRWSTTLSIRVRSSSFFRTLLNAPSSHIRLRVGRISSSSLRSPSVSRAISVSSTRDSSSAWRRARSACSQRRSSSAATSRFSGSTSRYCFSARRAS